jgi:hypothetical protein
VSKDWWRISVDDEPIFISVGIKGISTWVYVFSIPTFLSNVDLARRQVVLISSQIKSIKVLF